MLPKEDTKVEYCYCGRMLINKWGNKMCNIHKFEYYIPEKRKRIGKYSGRSKRFKGKYEDY